ncbi:MAG TPA: serine/threonine-protein kinase, partial [Byssovorax sp.]
MTDDEDLEGTDERTATARPRDGASESPRSIDDFTREGALVDGKYRVERVIGAGGMGVVVAAMHLALGERVALKFIKRGAASADAIERMRREARITFRLAGPHVARLLDVGDLPTGAPYLVMEHLAGEDLARTLARRGPLPVTEAVDYVMQACDGVAEAHELGVVHRDLKPSNLFLVSRKDGAPLVKVLDFGVAKARGLLGESSDVTTASSVLGSPLYMSPEQVRGAKHVDAASDVWSLGVILHELVAGAPPFARGPGSAVCAAIAADAPARLRD